MKQLLGLIKENIAVTKKLLSSPSFMKSLEEVICIVNKEGQMSFGKSPHFTLPPFVLEKVLNGEELGKVMGSYVGQHDLSKTSGAIGVLTRGVIDRKELYVSGILMALVPFLSPSLYFSSQTEVI